MYDLQMHDAMSSALIERGIVSPEEAAADRASLAAQLGVGGTEGTPTPQATTADPLQAVPGPDAAADPLFDGPAIPGAYDFGPPPQGVEVSLEQELGFRQLFHQEGIPVGIANEVGRLWNAACIAPPMTEAQNEQSRQECSAALHRMWGPEFQKNLDSANAVVDRLSKGNPNIPEMLKASGLRYNTWLIASLANLAKGKGWA